jgi:hypothetical protein
MMSNPNMDLLLKALIDGDQTGALAETRKLRDAGVGCEQIVTDCRAGGADLTFLPAGRGGHREF